MLYQPKMPEISIEGSTIVGWGEFHEFTIMNDPTCQKSFEEARHHDLSKEDASRLMAYSLFRKCQYLEGIIMERARLGMDSCKLEIPASRLADFGNPRAADLED